MRHQALRLGTLLDFLLDRLVQLGNGGVESIQQLQQIVSAAVGPRSQRKRLQLWPSSFPPQPLLEPQPFVEGDRLPLIHHAGSRLHHAVPVPQPLPHIPLLLAERQVCLDKPTCKCNDRRLDLPPTDFIVTNGLLWLDLFLGPQGLPVRLFIPPICRQQKEDDDEGSALRFFGKNITSEPTHPAPRYGGCRAGC